MQACDYDLCVIGGGINGAGIARDAAGRGLRVALLEAGDLACATSSASTKLIHGGLRYLEYYDFKLVRDSLKEREVLLRQAPHIIRPMGFVLPHDAGQRPSWMIRAGLFLYDHLASRKTLHKSYGVDLKTHDFGAPLQDQFKKGFCYADCWAEDARLVILNAMDAAAKGAAILPRISCVGVKPGKNVWRVHTRHTLTGEEKEITAAMVVNAAGPWVRRILEDSNLAAQNVPQIRLVKGSHIIILRAHDGEQAYILQQPDKRIVFVIPYENDFTLIGTTEEAFDGDPMAAEISGDETAYLCRAFNAAFSQQITPDDVVNTYSGVRPLLDDKHEDATAVTRDYCLHMHKELSAPLLSVFGGKLTTYRVLAEQAVNKMLRRAGREGKSWTKNAPLPGGDIKDAHFPAFLAQQIQRYPKLLPELITRYAKAYGTRMAHILKDAQSTGDLGAHFGDHIYEAEIDYLLRHEWAVTAEDILWRRSKLGLHVSRETVQNLENALPDMVKGAQNS